MYLCISRMFGGVIYKVALRTNCIIFNTKTEGGGGDMKKTVPRAEKSQIRHRRRLRMPKRGMPSDTDDI